MILKCIIYDENPQNIIILGLKIIMKTSLEVIVNFGNATSRRFSLNTKCSLFEAGQVVRLNV